MISELRALDAQIDDRLKRLERQSDFGRVKDIPASIGAGLLWETCQDIRLFLKYRDEAQTKDRAPMELAGGCGWELFLELEKVLHQCDDVSGMDGALKAWLAERSGG